MANDAPSLPELLTRLRAAWPAASWEWDGRFRCALSTVNLAGLAQARAALADALPALFTANSIGAASAVVAQLCARTGGLRGHQEVFAASLSDGITAYCLWWPWGSRTDFSARIGATGGDSDLTPIVKAAFSLDRK
jgi:hypothetical protein